MKVLPFVEEIQFPETTAETPTPVVQFRTPYSWVGYRALGQGYESVVAWVVDLASRMMERFRTARTRFTSRR